MAKSDIYNINPKTDKGPRNAFDLSHSCLFTAPCGELLPCYVEDVKRGDKLKLALMSVTRSRPVNTAAFMSFDQKIDFWFVPYRLLWSSYDQWRLSQTIRRSSLDMSDVGKQNLLPHASWYDVAQFYVKNTNKNSAKNPTFATHASATRLLDMLGYGLPPLQNITLLSSYNLLDDVNKRAIENYFFKLRDSGLKCNYFRLAAFQCIYMSSYRNEEFEELDPSYYNCDNLFITNKKYPSFDNGGNSSGISTPTTLAVSSSSSNPVLSFSKLFTPRYKNWRKDLFTSLKPASGFSANAPDVLYEGTQGTDFSWPSLSHPAPGSVQYASGRNFNNGFNGNYSRLDVVGSEVDGSFIGHADLYAHNIRLLMSQDKFSRLMIYADKNYSSQMRALFGVDVAEPNVPRYLGSFRSDVSISDVTATSAGSDGDGENASTTVLGQLAGKGYGNNSDKVFEESFGEDGIVMGIQYIMPRNNYDAYRVNRFNTKVSRWDYYYPEFDGLGMQPVFAYERNTSSSVDDSPTMVNPLTSVLGYAARFSEYKCRQSETHGCFAANQPDMNWTLSNNQFGIVNAGDFSCYKILPNITDRIFSMAYDGSQSTDPFMCYLQYAVTKVSNMEVLGLPKF